MTIVTAAGPSLTFEQILDKFTNVRRASDGYTATCPTHDSKSGKSLSIKLADDRALVYDHGSCTTENVLAAVGLTMADLFTRSTPSTNGHQPKPVIVATYDYCDENGTLLYQAVRYEPKDFRQRRPNGKGGWIWNMNGVRRVPYNLPDLLATKPGDTIFTVEGEKDADRLKALGYTATCNVGGAGKWDPAFGSLFTDRIAVNIPDNDEPGFRHVGQVAASQVPVGTSVKIVALPGLAPGGDVSDWLDAGHTPAELDALIAATPLYDPKGATWPPISPDGPLWNILAPFGDFERGLAPFELVRLSDVVTEDVRWLWPRYIPLGKITVVDGDPGLGKSTMMLDIAARTSVGKAMPDGHRGDLAEPAGVVILSAEDGLGDTIRPRLDGAGADVTRIVALKGVRDSAGVRLPTLEDLGAIEAAIRLVDAKLVIIDPVMAYLGADVNSYRDQDIRRLLAPIAALAERLGVAVVIVRHLNKGTGGSAIYRGGGSIGIIGAARSGLLVGKDPDDERKRVLVGVKHNLSAPPQALAFHMEAASDTSTASIVWDGPSNHSADSVLATPAGEEEVSALYGAKVVLREILKAGPVAAKTVAAEAKAAGVSERTLKRAKAALQVQVTRVGFGGTGGWEWSLPQPEEPPDPPDDDGDKGGQRGPESAKEGQENPKDAKGANIGEVGPLSDSDAFTLAADAGYPLATLSDGRAIEGQEQWLALLSPLDSRGRDVVVRYLLGDIPPDLPKLTMAQQHIYDQAARAGFMGVTLRCGATVAAGAEGWRAWIMAAPPDQLMDADVALIAPRKAGVRS